MIPPNIPANIQAATADSQMNGNSIHDAIVPVPRLMRGVRLTRSVSNSLQRRDNITADVIRVIQTLFFVQGLTACLDTYLPRRYADI